MIVCAFSRLKCFISKMLHHRKGQEKGILFTYSENRRIIWHFRGLILFHAGPGDNVQVLNIAASEHDVLVDDVRAWDLFVFLAFSAFGAVGRDIFEGYGVVVAVDFVEGANVSDVGLGDEG